MSNLWHYFPRGRRLPALERNILKYRAFEMVVILFHIEDLRSYVLGTIRANDKTCIPEGTKKSYKKAWAYLVDKGVITQNESDDIQRLTDYRNTIAHAIQQLTYDLSQERFATDYESAYAVKYDYKALRKLKTYRPKIEKGLRHMIVVLSIDHLMFEAADRTFEQELARLRKKINKLMAERQAEMKRLQEEVATLRDGELEQIGLYQPGNQVGENGKLTERGARVCEALFERKLTPLAVSYRMRLSYRATTRRYKVWKAKA
jgi:hypothetical protein